MTDHLTDLEALAQAASRGPWTMAMLPPLARDEDAAFIAAARDAVPALIAEVRALRARNASPDYLMASAQVAVAEAERDEALDALEKAEAERDEARAALAQVEALAKEHQSMVNPAPYTTERALIERLAALVGGDDRG